MLRITFEVPGLWAWSAAWAVMDNGEIGAGVVIRWLDTTVAIRMPTMPNALKLFDPERNYGLGFHVG